MITVECRRAELAGFIAARQYYAEGTLDRVYLEALITGASTTLAAIERGEHRTVVLVTVRQQQMFESCEFADKDRGFSYAGTSTIDPATG